MTTMTTILQTSRHLGNLYSVQMVAHRLGCSPDLVLRLADQLGLGEVVAEQIVFSEAEAREIVLGWAKFRKNP